MFKARIFSMHPDTLCILFPVDVEESTEVLLPLVKELREIGVSEVRLLHVVHPVDALAIPDLIEERRKNLIQYRNVLLDHGIPAVHGEVVIGIPWEEIAERAQSVDFAFIVMGSHGKGLLQRIFLGSQSENVLYHTDSSLLIIRLCMQDERLRLSQEHLFTHILYATDLSPGARMGISYLERMGRISPRLTIVHVEDIRHFEYASPKLRHHIRSQAEQELISLKEHLLNRGFGDVEIVLRKGNAIHELLDLIDEMQPSLLVIGAKGRYDIAERSLGGVAETLLHRAPVHVLLCRK